MHICSALTIKHVRSSITNTRSINDTIPNISCKPHHKTFCNTAYSRRTRCCPRRFWQAILTCPAHNLCRTSVHYICRPTSHLSCREPARAYVHVPTVSSALHIHTNSHHDYIPTYPTLSPHCLRSLQHASAILNALASAILVILAWRSHIPQDPPYPSPACPPQGHAVYLLSQRQARLAAAWSPLRGPVRRIKTIRPHPVSTAHKNTRHIGDTHLCPTAHTLTGQLPRFTTDVDRRHPGPPVHVRGGGFPVPGSQQVAGRLETSGLLDGMTLVPAL